MQNILDELQKLEAELHHPGSPCTVERLEQLLHPAFFEVGRSGRKYSRAQVIDVLVGKKEVPAVDASDYAVHRLSESCVLLTYTSVQYVNDKTLHAMRSSIWVHTGVGWQLCYHQGTPAPSVGM